MDLSKFTEKSQTALADAQQTAARLGHQSIDVEHLLLSLVQQEGGLVPRLVEKSHANLELLLAKLEGELDKMPQVTSHGGQPGNLYVTQRLNQLLAKAQDEAKELKDGKLDPVIGRDEEIRRTIQVLPAGPRTIRC
jgi:ATP-dependent Clp protease ATP-binding subunit ClpB